DSQDENLHELQSFSDVFYSKGVRDISRVNQEKQIEVSYQFNNEVYDSKELLEYARSEVEDIVANAGIPSDIAVELIQGESVLDEFKPLIILAFVLIFMILSSVFESFITPFVLLLSVPFAAIGSFFFLTITGNPLLQSNSIIGFIILLGIVVNNGIILIDFINVLQKNGYRKHRAILIAGLARVRPILITTITTCIAMLPLALGKGEYVKAIGPPFAITVIGGLTVSTLLTLVYIPMLYNGITGAVDWIKSLSISIEVTMLSMVVTGVALTVFYVDKFIWQLAFIILAVVGIPIVFWFVLSSLKRANARIIDEKAELRIKIDNLVKIYGRESKAILNYKAGRKMIERAKQKVINPRTRLESLIWQVPLIGFLLYFAWIYLFVDFWKLMVSVALYCFILYILNGYIKDYYKKWMVKLRMLILYCSPIAVLVPLYLSSHNLSLIIFYGIVWYMVLLVRYTLRIVRRENFNRKDIRKSLRWFVWFVMQISRIFYREKFKALRGVSL
ncbi:MAG: efflux RND transporter permease subunit, partial [Bacteroidales bacterium]|nr:efflux RND transporter permease subunit [Bacteroidales bacterium]